MLNIINEYLQEHGYKTNIEQFNYLTMPDDNNHYIKIHTNRNDINFDTSATIYYNHDTGNYILALRFLNPQLDTVQAIDLTNPHSLQQLLQKLQCHMLQCLN